jgi:hypothetical protein
MKRFTLGLLLCGFVICFLSRSATATAVRSSSIYGSGSKQLFSDINGTAEWIVGNSSISPFDLLLHLGSISAGSITITLTGGDTLSTSSFDELDSNSPIVGLLECGGSSTYDGPCTTSGSVPADCTPEFTSGGTTITLTGSCVASGLDFYFDVVPPSGSSISAATLTMTTPEPSSLPLIALGLIPLGFCLKRLE